MPFQKMSEEYKKNPIEDLMPDRLAQSDRFIESEEEINNSTRISEQSYYLYPDIECLKVADHERSGLDDKEYSASDTHQEIEGFIRKNFENKLPQFIEYQKKGYNTQGLTQSAINNLSAILAEKSSAKVSPLGEKILEQAAVLLHCITAEFHFLNSEKRENTIYDIHHLTEITGAALTALNMAETFNDGWKNHTSEVVSQHLNRISAEAINRINEVSRLPVSNENVSSLRQQLEGILFSQSYSHVAENIKFSLLKHSLLAEDRITHNRIALFLDQTASQIGIGTSEIMKYSLQKLYGEQITTDPGFCELPDYRDFTYLLSFRHEESADSPSGRLLKTVVSVSETLQGVAAALKLQAAFIRPVKERVTNTEESLLNSAITFIKRAPKKLTELNQQIRFAASVMGNEAGKAAAVISPRLGMQPVIFTDASRMIIRDVALLLLDELHQIRQRIKLLPELTFELQVAAEQRHRLNMQTAELPAQPVLDALVERELKKEQMRWDEKIKQSKAKLAEMIAPVTRYAQKEQVDDFCYSLANLLHSQPTKDEQESAGKEQFKALSDKIVQNFSEIAQEVKGAAVQLAGHGEVGAAELRKKAAGWLQQLTVNEGLLNTCVTRITGNTLDYFSRGGMLARGVAEWTQTIKQDFLQKMGAETVGPEAAKFDSVLMNIIEQNLTYFKKKSDPEAAAFKQRLKIELKNVAQNTTVYPPTPEEILAGVRTIPDDLRHWAEKKVVSGAISAALGQGFKIISGPLSLPGRFIMRSARSSLAIYRGTKAINRGVRVGQGPATSVTSQLIKRELSREALKLTLALSPLASWGLAATVTVERFCREDKYGKKLLTKTLTHLPEDLLWRGGYAGVTSLFRSVFDRAIQQSDEQANQQLAGAIDRPAIGEEIRLRDKAHSLPGQKGGDEKRVQPIDKSDYEEVEKSRTHHLNKRSVSQRVEKNRISDLEKIVSYRSYSELSDSAKKTTYLNAIKHVLLQIECDESLHEDLRRNAFEASIGKENMVPININGTPLNDMFFMPHRPGYKYGMIVDLSSRNPYYFINQSSDLKDEVLKRIPYHTITQLPVENKLIELNNLTNIFNKIKSGSTVHGGDNFNYYAPEPMNISELSESLFEYRKNDINSKRFSGKNLIERGIAGSQIPEPEFSAVPVKYKLEVTWEKMDAATYLRSFAQPFSTLSGQLQLIKSYNNEESIIETERNKAQAEYIGAWVDVTVGAVTSFSPTGIVINAAQSGATLAADIIEHKPVDPLMVAGLILSVIPEGKITAKIARFSAVGAKSVKYGLLLGSKVLDLTLVGNSLKTATETGEPLAIYQALLNSGMSVKNSYGMAKAMAANVNIKKTIEQSASLEQLESINNNTSGYTANVAISARPFRFGTKEMLGKIEGSKIYISHNGVNWEAGNQIHKLAYLLQHAGGKSSLPEPASSKSESHSQQAETQSKSQASHASGSADSLAKSGTIVNIHKNNPEGPSENSASGSHSKTETEQAEAASPNNTSLATLTETDPIVEELGSYLGMSDTTGPTGFARQTQHDLKLNSINRQALKLRFSGTKIEVYDPGSSKYIKRNDFELSRIQPVNEPGTPHRQYEEFISKVNDMLSKAIQLKGCAENIHGQEKIDVINNFDVLISGLQDIKKNDMSKYGDSSSSEVSYHILTKRNKPSNQQKDVFGIACYDYVISGSSLRLEFLGAHPYVIANKYPGLRKYLVENNIVSEGELGRFNIKNVAKYLGSKSLRSEVKYYESIPDTKVETFHFTGGNPITQRIGHSLQRWLNPMGSRNQSGHSGEGGSRPQVATGQDASNEQHAAQEIKARETFIPVQTVNIVSEERVQAYIKSVMEKDNAEIVVDSITEGLKSADREVSSFSKAVINSADKASEKVARVKYILEKAKTDAACKARLKKMIDEAVGLDDHIVSEVDKVTKEEISGMAYERFSENIIKLHDYLGLQKSKNYDAIVLFKHKNYRSSQPVAYALPFDARKRILLAIMSDNQQQGNLTDTLVHEASHNAHYSLDHTYLGDMRSQTGSFRPSFSIYARDSNHFFSNVRSARLSENYALGLPQNANITMQQSQRARFLLENSRLVKADTLLNSAEYNAYMIDVINNTEANEDGTPSGSRQARNKRATLYKNNRFDDVILIALLKATGQFSGGLSDNHMADTATQRIVNSIQPHNVLKIKSNTDGLPASIAVTGSDDISHAGGADLTQTPVKPGNSDVPDSLKEAVKRVMGQSKRLSSNKKLSETSDSAIYSDFHHNYYMKIDKDYYPYTYYRKNASGYLKLNGRALTVIRDGGAWVTAGIIPPVSNVDNELSRKVAEAVAENKRMFVLYRVGAYSPVSGDFIRSNGDGIYLSRRGEAFIYINNHYFPFFWGGEGTDYTGPKYQGRTGYVLAGNQNIRVFRKNSQWGLKEF